ncbi:hypothetical protein BD410DRAFT_791932 [Rickenella mellea]|uniref:Uncharacterized protein n=1 Tax=Rickenella mellea TaxID=50990 RepID=A0A4Y7PVX0_9AGAM|nr:hypothetical protein BD410DRAFT_791932 [Rickenella mellea]
MSIKDFLVIVTQHRSRSFEFGYCLRMLSQMREVRASLNYPELYLPERTADVLVKRKRATTQEFHCYGLKHATAKDLDCSNTTLQVRGSTWIGLCLLWSSIEPSIFRQTWSLPFQEWSCHGSSFQGCVAKIKPPSY